MKLKQIKLSWPILVILVLYFFLRLQNLQSIPVFGDEAIYLRWSQLIKNVETLRFVPVSDGKQPLFMWLTAVSYKFISDPLVAGRLISVFSGAGIIVGLFIFSQIFFSPAVAYISTLIYLFIPFSFFFDRLALTDNLLSFFGVGSIIFAFLLAKYPRLDLSLILGFSLGLAWLTKSPAIYFICLAWLTFIVFRRNNYKKIYFPLISTFIAFVIYNVLRLGPQFQQIALRNKDYVWSLPELVKHPLDPFISHLKDIFTLYLQYISLPIIVVAAIGLFLSFRKKNSQSHWLVAAWWLLPLLANAAIAKTFTARYILFTLPPLIILISSGVYSFVDLTQKYFHSRYLQLLIIILCLLPNFYWIYRTSTQPFEIRLPSTETGYISSWTSGWGIKSAGLYLIDRSKNANVIVGTEGYFGTLPDGLQIYTDSLPQLTIFGVGLDITEIPPKLIDARQHGDEVYLLFNQSRLKLTKSAQEKTSLIRSYPKPAGDNLLLLKLI